MDYNGGALIAMKGKNCVAIASDKRFGVTIFVSISTYIQVYYSVVCLIIGASIDALLRVPKDLSHPRPAHDWACWACH